MTKSLIFCLTLPSGPLDTRKVVTLTPVRSTGSKSVKEKVAKTNPTD